jgi:hypothetical protein
MPATVFLGQWKVPEEKINGAGLDQSKEKSNPTPHPVPMPKF